MSVPVAIDEISELSRAYGPSAYVLVGVADGPPRVTHATVTWVDGVAEVSVGRRSRAALSDNPTACLLWPATTDQTMSLIVDVAVDPSWGGDGDAETGRVRLRPTGAVRHRPA